MARDRAQGLGKEAQGGELDGLFACLGEEPGAFATDEITHVEEFPVGENVVAKGLLLGVNLEFAELILDVGENAFTHGANGNQTARDADGFVFLERVEGVLGGEGVGIGRAEGVYTELAPGFELLLTQLE